MNPTPSKSIRPGLPVRLHAALAASLSRACPRLPALAALCLLATPGVSRADSIGYWTVTGTQPWTTTSGGTGDGLRTVTGQLLVGYSGTDGTLNQDAGTITLNDPTYETIIGQVANGTYNMSGTASFLTTVKATLLGNSGNSTWTLTDSANASVAALNFGNGNDTRAQHKVQYSKDLGQADLWTSHEAVVPGAVGSSDVGSVHFEATANGGLIHVVATVAASEASTDGKLFGRLQATE